MNYSTVSTATSLLVLFAWFLAPSTTSNPRVAAQVAMVEVDDNGKVQVNGEHVAMENLALELQHLSSSTTTYVVLTISPDMPMGYMGGLMDELRVSNIAGLSYEGLAPGKGIEFVAWGI